MVMDSVESVSIEEADSNQYTLTRVEELEVAAAILVVFLVNVYEIHLPI